MKSQDIDQIKDVMRAPWIAGNFGAIAKTIGALDAEGFVARLALEPNVRVLDIACGTGNVTLPLARRGSTATGLDMTPHLLEEARVRAASEGLDIRFDEGFAEALPYPDASFDMVVSMFGIMFSPAPETIASEMARVLRPGGRLALANWTPSGFNGKLPAIVGRYLPPPPPGAMSPFLWGEEAAVRERLEPGFDSIQTRVVPITWELQTGVAASAAFFAHNSGPIQLTLGRLDAPKRAALLQDLEQLWIDNNLAADRQNHTLIGNEYLMALAIRRQVYRTVIYPLHSTALSLPIWRIDSHREIRSEYSHTRQSHRNRYAALSQATLQRPSLPLDCSKSS